MPAAAWCSAVDHELARHLAVFRALGGGCDFLIAEACEIGLIVGDESARLRAGQKLLLELGRERGVLLVDFLELVLVGVRQVGAGMDELVVIDCEELQVLAFEMDVAALIIDGLHTREELGVQEDRVGVSGELRRLIGLHLVERVVGVGLHHTEERTGRAIKHAARLLKRHDRVRKRRLRFAVCNRLDFGDLLLHALFESGLIIAVVDLVEGRRVQRQRAGLGERIRRCGQHRTGSKRGNGSRAKAKRTEAIHRVRFP